MSALQIEEGKFYKRRDGKVRGPAERYTDSRWGVRYPWRVGGINYADTGNSLLDKCTYNDLIEEVPNPNRAIDNETLTTTFAPVEGLIGLVRDNANGTDDSQIVEGFGNVPASRDINANLVYSNGAFPAPLGGWSGDEVLVYAPQSAGVSVPEENLVLPTPTEKKQWSKWVPDPETVTRATDLAQTAANLVGGDRDRQHGQKRDNFTRIAAVWNAWLGIRKDKGAPLDAHDVGCMMAMMKLARTQSGKLNLDDYIDAAGYAACAGEVAQTSG